MSTPPGPTTTAPAAATRPTAPARSTTDGTSTKRFGRKSSRQARVVIRKVRPWSVLKVSFFLYLCIWAVIVGAVVILYGMLGAIGALDSTQELIREVFAEPGFEIQGEWLFTRGIMIALGMVLLWTLINVFVALLYNLISDVIGGIEVTLSERR